MLTRTPVQNFAPYAAAKFCAACWYKFLRRTLVQNFAPHAGSKFCAVCRCKILRRTPVQNFALYTAAKFCAASPPHAGSKFCTARPLQHLDRNHIGHARQQLPSHMKLVRGSRPLPRMQYGYGNRSRPTCLAAPPATAPHTSYRTRPPHIRCTTLIITSLSNYVRRLAEFCGPHHAAHCTRSADLMISFIVVCLPGQGAKQPRVCASEGKDSRVLSVSRDRNSCKSGAGEMIDYGSGRSHASSA